MIIICDQLGCILYLNAAVTARLGYALEDLRSLPVTELFPVETREETWQIFRLLLTGEQETAALQLSSRNGSCIPTEVWIWMGLWEQQSCAFVIARDLSKEQAALHRFNKIFQFNPAPMLLTSIPEGRVVDVNEAFERCLGYRRDETVGRRFSEIDFFTSQTDSACIQQNIARREPLACDELELRTREGTILSFQMAGEIIDTLETSLCLTVLTDLTEIRKAQDKLRFQARLQDMLMKMATEYINLPLEQVHAAIRQSLADIGQFVGADRVCLFDYDFQRQTAFCTYEWCAAGIPPKIPALQEIPLVSIPGWLDRHRRGEFFQVERVSELPDDSLLRQFLGSRQVESLLTLPLVSGEECLGFIGFDSCRQAKFYTSEEISLLQMFAQILVNSRNREQQERKLQAAKDQAEKATRIKSQFLANMSHEIRTPLNSVLGYLQLLEVKEDDPEKQQLISKMESSTQTLLNVINDILDVSKIEAGKLQLEQQPFALRSAIEAAVESYAYAAKAKGLNFILDLDPDLPAEVIGDPLRLRQILANLCSNAIKFTEQGTILVGAWRAEQAGDWVDFRVEDSGIGIPPAQLATIFEPFVQGDSTLPRRYGGTGLGLTICRELVSLMGGSIHVTSSPGKGSQFFFSIPFSRPDTRAAGEQPPPKTIDREPETTWLLSGDRTPAWLTRQQWHTFLEEEARLLEIGDYAAVTALEQLIDGRNIAELADELRSLAVAIFDFDFDHALLQVRNLLQLLDGDRDET
jgi:PAS domain S-box-containing protein